MTQTRYAGSFPEPICPQQPHIHIQTYIQRHAMHTARPGAVHGARHRVPARLASPVRLATSLDFHLGGRRGRARKVLQ